MEGEGLSVLFQNSISIGPFVHFQIWRQPSAWHPLALANPCGLSIRVASVVFSLRPACTCVSEIGPVGWSYPDEWFFLYLAVTVFFSLLLQDYKYLDLSSILQQRKDFSLQVSTLRWAKYNHQLQTSCGSWIHEFTWQWKQCATSDDVMGSMKRRFEQSCF